MPLDALAHQVIPVVEALESMGADADAVLERAGLRREDIADPATRLDDTVEQRMWDAIVSVTGREQAGLELAAHVRAGTLGAYEYLLRNAGTLAQTIEWADRYMRLVDTRTRIAVVTRDDLAIIRVWRHDGSILVPEGIECLFAVIARLGRERIPKAHQLAAVSMAHEAIGDVATYEAVFGCPVYFGALAYELALPASALESPLDGADPGLGEVLREHVEALLASAPPADPILERAWRLLSEGLDREAFGVEDLAKGLAVSPRTLRRRLETAGTSYSALLEDVRRERAAHYLAHTDEGLAEIASKLGFAEPSTFYRAFKRWTSQTPAQYRKRARARATG